MPGLIQTPNSPDLIREFLADGNTQSTPAVTQADINDGDLLNATRTIESGSGYHFAITLPSGRTIESAPVGSDYPKRDAIMQWLGAIREAIVEDAAVAGRAARDAQLAEPATPGSSATGPADGVRAVAAIHADPVDYAKAQLRAAIERLAALSMAEAEVAKWQRVVNSLTGESNVPKRKRRRKKRKLSLTVPINTGL